MNALAYPKTKKSGVEWLGDVPEHWEVRRLNDVASLKTSNVDKKSVDGQSEVRLCNYVDVYYNDKITSDIEFMVATASKDEIEKFRLEKGDVVFTKDSESPFDIGIPALVDESIDDLVCGYHLAIIKASESELHGPFLFYALTAQPSVYQFTLAANGVTRFGLSQSGTKNIRVLVPSMDEQRSIAEFLDRKTGRIDELIGKKKGLIGKLNEQRSALITAAVTGKIPEIGSRKSAVRMKDSGVEWLGQIPEHWAVAALRWFIRAGSGDYIAPSDVEKESSGEYSYPVIGGNGIMAYAMDSNTPANALVLGRVGAHCGNVHLIREACWVTDNALRIRLVGNELMQIFMFWLFKALRLNDSANKNAQPLSITDIMKKLMHRSASSVLKALSLMLKQGTRCLSKS